MAGHRLNGSVNLTGIACIATLLLAGLMVFTSDAKQPELRPSMRLPDSMTMAWTAAVANRHGGTDDPTTTGSLQHRPAPSFSPQAALLPNLENIEIRDLKTGQMLHDIPVGDMVGAIANASGVIVAQTDDSSPNAWHYNMLRAYDQSSGRQLWSQRLETRHLLETGRSTHEVVFHKTAVVVTTRGVVITRPEGELIGLDLKTGERLWNRRLPCAKDKHKQVSATASTAAILCDGVLDLVNPETGESRRVHVAGVQAGLATTPDAIAVSSQRTHGDSAPPSLMVVAESGKVLGRISGSRTLVQMYGDQAIVAGPKELRAVSLARGTVLWRRMIDREYAFGGYATGSDASLAASDGLVMINSERERGRPGTTSFTDPSGLTTPPLPWPVTGEFVDAVSGMVFVVSHAAYQYQFTALRLDNKNPPDLQLGGAEPSDWPDPCRLLTPEQLAKLGRGYVGVHAPPTPTAARLRLPHTDQCNFTGPHSFSLQIGWVSADHATAATLTQSLLPEPDRVWQAGPNGYQHYYSIVGELSADRAVVMQGRRVINVFAPGQVKLTGQIARLLQANEEPAPYSPGSPDKDVIERILNTYGFTGVIQVSPPNPGPLRAIYARCGPGCSQVFLFHGLRLVGAPPGQSASRPFYWGVQVLRQDGINVRLLATLPAGNRGEVRPMWIDLTMRGDTLMYRIDFGLWQVAPAAPSLLH